MIPGTTPSTWYKRNYKWFVPTICIGGLLSVAGFAALIFCVVFGVMKSSDAYKEAVARAKADPTVIQALGSPITEGFFVTGNIRVNNSSGYANLAIPISGPNGNATIYVVASKSEGQWTFQRLIVGIVKTGLRIDLTNQKTPSDQSHPAQVGTTNLTTPAAP